MPTYTVFAHKDGGIKLLTTDQVEERTDADDENETEVGSFSAENSSEAWRQFVNANPSVDLDKRRISIQVGQDTAEGQKALREAQEEAMEKAIGELEVPAGSDPDTYSDEAMIKKGEMESPEDRQARRERERDPERAGAEENAKPRSTTQRNAASSSGKAKDASGKSSAADKGDQPKGAPDAGSPNQGSAAGPKGSSAR